MAEQVMDARLVADTQHPWMLQIRSAKGSLATPSYTAVWHPCQSWQGACFSAQRAYKRTKGPKLGPRRRLASMRKLARCDSRILARSASALAASAALCATASAAPGSPPRSACVDN